MVMSILYFLQLNELQGVPEKSQKQVEELEAKKQDMEVQCSAVQCSAVQCSALQCSGRA